jgi:hypothetical protein
MSDKKEERRGEEQRLRSGGKEEMAESTGRRTWRWRTGSFCRTNTWCCMSSMVTLSTVSHPPQPPSLAASLSLFSLPRSLSRWSPTRFCTDSTPCCFCMHPTNNTLRPPPSRSARAAASRALPRLQIRSQHLELSDAPIAQGRSTKRSKGHRHCSLHPRAECGADFDAGFPLCACARDSSAAASRRCRHNATSWSPTGAEVGPFA